MGLGVATRGAPMRADDRVLDVSGKQQSDRRMQRVGHAQPCRLQVAAGRG